MSSDTPTGDDERIEEGQEGDATPSRSHIAEDISDLKSTILKVAAEREKLPQPLFWSLFRSRVESIRKEKELRRVISEELG